MFNNGQKPLYILILACFQIVGIGLFCKGFFPYKIYLPGYAIKDDSFKFDIASNVEPEFDRLVFVVIDALRNDFIFGDNSAFDFVNSQINQGSAHPFTAKATAPTVTMPRIKALTTGTIPSFLDAILNIAESDSSSSLDFYDNWVYQFKNNGNKTIHFFGDDTWIRLFPNLFSKTDGTTSFFVSDTVEVDLNVTRHIHTDLKENDWDAVIFHYLGLDHIGHLGGPNSPLMKPKQKEMDQAIESIYQIVAKQDSDRMIKDGNAKGTLIVVCGDHGMNEQGNHGGSSIGETSAGLVLLSPKFVTRPTLKSRKPFWFASQPTALGHPIVDQIDIVPTLSALFGFPIPKNNLGKTIFNLHDVDKVDSVLHGLRANAYQLGQLLARLLPEVSKFLVGPDSHVKIDTDKNNPGKYYAEARSLHEQYSTSGREDLALDAIKLYNKFIDVAQLHLANTATDYNLNMMISGVTLISASAVGFIIMMIRVMNKTHHFWRISKLFSVFAIAAYSASMLASSFVEEEQSTWYYIVQTTFMLSVLHSLRLQNQTNRERWYAAGLNITQMFLVRIAIGWKDKHLLETVSPYIFGLKWHLMALTFLGTLIANFRSLSKLKEENVIDVSQTANIVKSITKLLLLLICTLNCVFILVYKIKSEGATDIPEVYRNFINWEVIQSLDQVQLGRLIFNYWGAGLFVLFGLFFITKRATLMDIGVVNIPKKKTSIFLQSLLHLTTPMLILLSGSSNATLFIVYNVQLTLLLLWQNYLSDENAVPVWLVSTIISGLSHSAFFMTGHSNSIASVDLSNAYIGVKEYDTVLIGALTFCSNWSASIYWSIAGWALVENVEKLPEIKRSSMDNNQNEELSIKEETQPWLTYLVSQSSIFSLVLAVLSISVTILREHLFIWTVFSPKYLYQIAWSLMYHWMLQVVIGSFVTQIIFRWKFASDSTDTVINEQE